MIVLTLSLPADAWERVVYHAAVLLAELEAAPNDDDRELIALLRALLAARVVEEEES